MTMAQDGVRFSALRACRLYPQEMLLVLFLLEAELTPGPQCDRKDFMSMKNSIDTSWDRISDIPISLNHFATAVSIWESREEISWKFLNVL